MNDTAGQGTSQPHSPEARTKLRAALGNALKDGLEPTFRRFLSFRGTAPDEWIELRALEVRDKTAAVRGIGVAYTRTPGESVRLLTEADGGFNAQGIYVSANELERSVASRLAPDCWHTADKGSATKDKEIKSRRVLFLDFDPERPAGTSADRAQWLAAFTVGVDAYLDLATLVPEQALGFGSSGNGSQVYLALDSLPNSPEVDGVTAGMLAAAGQLYDRTVGEVIVKTDSSVGNPARICPAWGTTKRKGFPSEDYPHRRTFFSCAEHVRRLTLDNLNSLLVALMGRLSAKQQAEVKAEMERQARGVPGRPLQTVQKAGGGAKRDSIWARINAAPILDVASALGMNTEHPTCPWCGAGGNTSVAILPDLNRMKCQHDTCGRRSASPVDLIAKMAFGLDAVKGNKQGVKSVLNWAARHLGIESGRPVVECSDIGVTDYEPRSNVVALNPARGGKPPVKVVGTKSEPLRRWPTTDLGNAERLVQLHGDDIRYCHPWAKWLVWDKQRWRVDDSGAVVRMARATVRSIYAEAAREEDSNRRTGLASWARHSESAPRIHAMVDLARSFCPIRVEELDQDPWLLNVLNGTIDLRTGQLRPHAKGDYITKLAGVAYARDAESPTWEAFLARVQPEADVRDYLARRVGYGATGAIREHVLTIDYGTGANGKSTFDDSVQNVLGDYAVVVPTQVLLGRKTESHPTELTVLHGARYASCAETEQGRSLNVALVKQLTGGDRISARRMREDFWTFVPTHKLSVATNHRPRIRETGHAIWRRVHLVPWNVVIPEQEQDRDLTVKLRAEASGILAWVVRGCLAWQRIGLAPPQAVVAATQAYREDEDAVGQFLLECTASESGSRVERKALRRAYDTWCEERGDAHTMSARNFHEALQERGIREANPWKVNKQTLRGWADIRLTAESRADDELSEFEVEELFSGLQVAEVAAGSGITPLKEPQAQLSPFSVQPVQPATDEADDGFRLDPEVEEALANV